MKLTLVSIPLGFLSEFTYDQNLNPQKKPEINSQALV